MIIKLKYGFFIEVDEKNFTLKSEYTNTKTGKPATKIHGYYTQFNSAINQYIKLATLNVSIEQTLELQSFVDKIKAICDETVEAVACICKKELGIQSPSGERV